MSSPASWDIKPDRNDTRAVIKAGWPTSGTDGAE